MAMKFEPTDEKNGHRWGFMPELSREWQVCIRCGIVRRVDDKNKPCKGKLPKITTREEPHTNADA